MKKTSSLFVIASNQPGFIPKILQDKVFDTKEEALWEMRVTEAQTRWAEKYENQPKKEESLSVISLEEFIQKFGKERFLDGAGIEEKSF
jgi:hypothetical protein